MITKFIESGGLDFLSEVEKQLECASACEIPMFYAATHIARGKPSKDCANAIVDKLQDTATPAGIVASITGVLLLSAMCGTFPLCSGYNDPYEEDGKV